MCNVAFVPNDAERYYTQTTGQGLLRTANTYNSGEFGPRVEVVYWLYAHEASLSSPDSGYVFPVSHRELFARPGELGFLLCRLPYEVRNGPGKTGYRWGADLRPRRCEPTQGLRASLRYY